MASEVRVAGFRDESLGSSVSGLNGRSVKAIPRVISFEDLCVVCFNSQSFLHSYWS